MYNEKSGKWEQAITNCLKRWRRDALDVLHTTIEAHVISTLEVHLLVMPVQCIVVQSSDIQLACRICREKPYECKEYDDYHITASGII